MNNPRCHECGRLIKTEKHEVWCKYAGRAQREINKHGEVQSATPDGLGDAVYMLIPSPMPTFITIDEAKRIIAARKQRKA